MVVIARRKYFPNIVAVVVAALSLTGCIVAYITDPNPFGFLILGCLFAVGLVLAFYQLCRSSVLVAYNDDTFYFNSMYGRLLRINRRNIVEFSLELIEGTTHSYLLIHTCSLYPFQRPDQSGIPLPKLLRVQMFLISPSLPTLVQTLNKMLKELQDVQERPLNDADLND